MGEIADAALRDAEALQSGGVDALMIENFGDVPFAKGRVPSATVAAMAAVGSSMHSALRVPFGFNVLRNDGASALGLCAALEGSFIRVNVLSGSMSTDQGIIEGDAFAVLRRRAALCPHVRIIADVHVKHAQPIGGGPIGEAARDALERGLADALVISGTGTGVATDLSDLEAVRLAAPDAFLYVGSGTTLESLPSLRKFASGFIVGSALKVDGELAAPVDRDRVAAMAEQIGAGA